ncbi:MAG: Smr/MutS family protein [Bacteroidetes bacterium]|uniref:Endonuclease MutS2 n=1 Tax=Candidatus Cryptobacteroides faecigallinarum TaxID=2840763 RepID=A0A9D9IKM3_9BACT|nr:Smr/MutS family protein [Candidatus Cryptobacteroides faecigallinarum]
MEKTPIDSRLEQKLGFDRMRKAIADRCSTSYAADKVSEERFSSDADEIRRRLLLTDEMRLIVMFEESFPSNGFIDCLGFLKPLAQPLSGIDLLSLRKLKTMLETLSKIISFFDGIKDGIYPNLKKMSASIMQFPEIRRRIDTILDRFGDVKDTASDELFEIRRSMKEKENAISRRIASVLKRAQEEGIVDSDASISMRDGKMLIPVPAGNKKKIQGFIYDESASGKTAFVEPAEVVELDNQIKELKFAEGREILRILMDFSDFLRPYVPDLIGAAEYLGEIDFLMAKANVALDIIAGMPVISDNGELNLRKARHPFLEKALKRENKEIVPLTVTLTPKKHILLISGPNAGGKSVCLKTVGLLQYMFQWGMPIPTSESSELPVFDRIMVSIGDDQSIDNDLSTYSSFLADMKDMLARADGKSLVLIDEFGSGTEPAAGGAIAEAILNELDKRGTYGVITTHYTNLKLYASSGDTGVVNGAMMFDVKNIAPLFKLEMGLPGNSFAFELARKMGLPESIIKDAETRAGEEFVGIERNLRRIARNRKAIDEKLEKIRHTDKTLESITEKYQKELLDIKQIRKEILDQAHKEAEEIVRGANRQIETTIRTIKEKQAEKAATHEARKDLQDFVSALAKKKEQEKQERDDYIEKKIRQIDARRERERERKARRAGEKERQAIMEEQAEKERIEAFRNAPLKPGEKVRVKSNGMVGEVSQISSRSITVNIGNIVSKMSPDKVERITSNEFKSAVKETARPVIARTDSSISERKLNFHPEIDVRGERVQDALDKVMRFIDDAIMLNMGSVRIIHGKGTGALREEIQKFLRTTPGVGKVSDEQVQFGGTGVTIVTLE